MMTLKDLATASNVAESTLTRLVKEIGLKSYQELKMAAEEGVMRFTRAGKNCPLFKDQSIQLMTSAIVGPQDVVIGISNSGYSIAVIESLKLARSKSIRTIVITSFENSPLVKYADIRLFPPTKSPPHGPGLYSEATTSKSAQPLVIDLLCACYAARHFDETLRFLEETFLAVRSTRCA